MSSKGNVNMNPGLKGGSSIMCSVIARVVVWLARARSVGLFVVFQCLFTHTSSGREYQRGIHVQLVSMFNLNQ